MSEESQASGIDEMIRERNRELRERRFWPSICRPLNPRKQCYMNSFLKAFISRFLENLSFNSKLHKKVSKANFQLPCKNYFSI